MASASGVAGFSLSLFFFVLASMPGINEASRRIIEGGDEGWKFGFNYSEWATQNAPFFRNDTLGNLSLRCCPTQSKFPRLEKTIPNPSWLSRFQAPNMAKHLHNVLLLKNRKSDRNCDVLIARIVGDETQGGGTGFEFVLGDRKRYFFACGMKNGVHCMFGNMKFFVSPLAENA